MILQSLKLQHFRSYNTGAFSFSPKTSLIIGPNASGKTNILEAIMFCATGKSFRAEQDQEAIAWDQDIARVKAQIDATSLELMLTHGEVGEQKAPLKRYSVNGVTRRIMDFVGNLRAVLFWPEHLELVTDSPSLRRRYLDSVLVQIDREYRRNLTSYERGLRQRNKLLDAISEGNASRAQLLFWNQLLIKAGSYLTDARAALIDFINGNKNFSLQYDKSVISESRITQYADEEVAAKATLVGPHRDDIIFYKDNRELGKYGSRGEQRLAILWLKLAELEYITERSREAGSGSARPILLLDDIFSELDTEHRNIVVGLIDKQQTIITSANSDIMAVVGKDMQIMKL